MDINHVRPQKYRKRPVVVEAVQYTGDNLDTVRLFLGDASCAELEVCPPIFLINTLEGQMRADVGDWIIRGTKNELYPCKPDIFPTIYEPADEEA